MGEDIDTHFHDREQVKDLSEEKRRSIPLSRDGADETGELAIAYRQMRMTQGILVSCVNDWMVSIN